MADSNVPIIKVESADERSMERSTPDVSPVRGLSPTPSYSSGDSSSEWEAINADSVNTGEADSIPGIADSLYIPSSVLRCSLQRHKRRVGPQYREKSMSTSDELRDAASAAAEVQSSASGVPATDLSASRQLEPNSPRTPPSSVRSLYWTKDLLDNVKIRRWRGASKTPVTVPAMFKKMMEKNKSQRALAIPIVSYEETVVGKNIVSVARSWTYGEYYDDCILAAKGLIRHGLEIHHSVMCILDDRSPTWHIINMAAIMAGGKSVVIDQDTLPEDCLEIANHSLANIVVVDNPQKILKVISGMTHVKALVYSRGVVMQEPTGIKRLHWEELMALGGSTDAELLQSRMDNLNPSNCCSVIYTNDHETGKLRGAMLSHDNITWSCKRFIEATQCVTCKERVVSYNSLADINYHMMDIYAMIASGGCCYFVPDEETPMSTIIVVQPTMLLGGSEWWERCQKWIQILVEDTEVAQKEKIRTHLKDNPGLLERIEFMLKIDSLEECVDRIYKQTIRRGTGLNKCRLLSMSVFDQASRSTLAYFQSMGLSLWEQYGTVETTGPVFTTSFKDEYALSGKCYRGTRVKFENEELLINSRQVFMGYLLDGPGTVSAITDSCWFKTGVSGYKEILSGTVNITGSVKDMIVLKSGVKVAPLPLENAILKELPIADEAVVVGEGREYLTCLITLKVQEIKDDAIGRISYLDPIVKTTLGEHRIVRSTVGDLMCKVSTLEDFNNEDKATILNGLMKSALKKVREEKKHRSKLMRRIALLRPTTLIPNLDRSKKREFILKSFRIVIEDLYKEELSEKTEARVLPLGGACRI